MKKFKASSVLVSVLATGIVLLSGCGKEDEVNNIITNNITIEDVLSSQDSDLNQSLSALNYSDDLSDYSNARTKKSISSCSRALSNLGKKLLESSVCTLLDIDVENVVDFQVSWNDKSKDTDSDAVNATITYNDYVTNVVPGNISVVDKTEKVKKFRLVDEAKDIGQAICSAQDGEIYDLEFIDSMYKALERFVLTKGESYSDWIDGDCIKFTYDDDKIKQFKIYSKNLNK